MKNTIIISKSLMWVVFLAMPVITIQAAGNTPGIVHVEAKQSGAQTVLGSTVVPYKEVTLAAQIPGRVISISGDVGTMISENNIIAKIDDGALQAKRRSVLAGLNSAQASLRNSQVQHTRELVSPRSKDISAMPGFGLPSMMDIYMTRPMYDMMGNNYNENTNRYSDLINSSTGVAQARSQVMQAWSQLSEIDARLKDSVAMAPFTGMILEKLVEVGDTVQPGQPLVKFAYIEYKRLKADVPAMMVDNLKVGMVVPVVINGNRHTIAKVAQIYPVADPTRHTFTVKFDLKRNVNASPGMYAEISIPNRTSGTKTVLVIPRTALLKGRSLDSVLMINKKGTSELRLVRLGADQGDGKVAVTSGLRANDKVIDQPPASATSGWMPPALVNSVNANTVDTAQ